MEMLLFREEENHSPTPTKANLIYFYFVNLIIYVVCPVSEAFQRVNKILRKTMNLTR